MQDFSVIKQRPVQIYKSSGFMAPGDLGYMIISIACLRCRETGHEGMISKKIIYYANNNIYLK